MQTKNIILLIFSLILSLAVIEIITRKTTCFPINTSTENIVYDEILLYTMNTKIDGINKDGFRNEKLLEQADIVTLGDSHTYCFNAENNETWPIYLEKLINKSVYNMGIGGYGFIQYFSLTKKSISLNPRYILIGLYLPNDLEDIANAINFSQYWQKWFKSKNIDISDIFDSTQINIPTNAFTIFMEKVFFSSAIASLIKHTLQTKINKVCFIKTNKNDLILEDKNHKTIFTDIKIKTLNSYLNLKIPHVKRSLDLAKMLTEEMIKEIKSAGITPVFVFIPSKENTFYEYLKQNGHQLSDEFEKLVTNERKITDIFTKFLDDNNAKHIKIKDYIDRKNIIEKTTNMYPKNDDEHVLPAGYKVYADAVYEYLSKQEEKI